MKILYAIQSTGNGHIARAQEVLPILKKYAEVDILFSGHQSQLKLDDKAKFRFPGISLLYNKKGGLSYGKILFKNSYLKAIQNINQIPLDDYDLVLNDFEPITAWACKLKGKRSVQMSHQCALLYDETPKPKDILGAAVVQYYAPAKEKIGFHFKPYHPEIQPPVIRSKIRNLNMTNGHHYVVYLPSFYDDVLINTLSKIPVEWKVFSKYANESYQNQNVEIFPINEPQFLEAFASCKGILCNAGFETPSEALFLGKKLFVIPIKNQYEQYCNTLSLNELGVKNSLKLSVGEIQNWVQNGEVIHIPFKDTLEEIILKKVIES